MGYTHYWTQTKDFTDAQWQQFTAEVDRVAQAAGAAGVALGDGLGEGVGPVVEADHVALNGRGDEGCETFCILREVEKRAPRYEGDNPAWDFCKTRREPYDDVVTHLLAYLRDLGTHEPTSDGGPSVFTLKY